MHSQIKMNGEIVLLPVGEVDRGILAHLGAALTEAFGCRCRVGDALPAPEYAYNPRRAQYSAEMILTRLVVAKAGRVLGVTDCDLYVPELNFVFGLASRARTRALIALPRLRQSFYGRRDDHALFLARTAKEAVHELDHTYGLGHCRDRRCVMRFSNSLDDTDDKGQEFCATCRKKTQT